MPRARLRDLGLTIGRMPVGPYNAITDVPGILVGHTTLIHDEPRVARTGVTVIVPRDGEIWNDMAFCGYFSFNGNGEMTGIPWIEESGILGSIVGITNTHQVGMVRDSIVEYAIESGRADTWLLPIVAETYDGFLNDIDAFHLTKEHVFQAIGAASSGTPAEGNVGGGTGMLCHDFKGGIGTSSRLVDTRSGRFTVGALVQSNYGYGARSDLRVDGVPVGLEIGPEITPLPGESVSGGGSIIIVVATDAPLLPIQCQRLAKRAAVGLSRAGGSGHNGSGDIFMAFSTGNHVTEGSQPLEVKMFPLEHISPVFDGVAEAVEESIINALTSAETMTGFRGRTAHALPLDELQKAMNRYGRHS